LKCVLQAFTKAYDAMILVYTRKPIKTSEMAQKWHKNGI